MKPGLRILIPLLLALAIGCGSGGAPEGGEGPAPGEPVATAGASEETEEETAGRPPGGAAPSGPIDEVLAERGEEVFEGRGCVACHTIGGGRLTGPDLAGVTGRRSYDWFVGMVTKPDSMTLHDPAARELMGEYMTQMPNLGVTPDEARALWEHVREETGEAEGEDEVGEMSMPGPGAGMGPPMRQRGMHAGEGHQAGRSHQPMHERTRHHDDM